VAGSRRSNVAPPFGIIIRLPGVLALQQQQPPPPLPHQQEE